MILKSAAWCLFILYIMIQKRLGMVHCLWIVVGCLIIGMMFQFSVKQLKKKYILQHQFPLFSIQENYQPSLEEYFEPHCQICLEVFQPSDSIVELKCGCQIIYHKDCLFTWLQQEMTCPVCKTCMKDLMI